VQLEKPIFGAIAVVVKKKSDYGHHVGFFYSQPGDSSVVLLGGNQSDRIMFTQYSTVGDDSYRYFVPVSYAKQAKADAELPMDTTPAAQLNKAFGISTSKVKHQKTR
jgi:hypothetical protein